MVVAQVVVALGGKLFMADDAAWSRVAMGHVMADKEVTMVVDGAGDSWGADVVGYPATVAGRGGCGGGVGRWGVR